MDRLRVASLQYFIRPVATFDAFRDQVAALIETAADYRASWWCSRSTSPPSS